MFNAARRFTFESHSRGAKSRGARAKRSDGVESGEEALSRLAALPLDCVIGYACSRLRSIVNLLAGYLFIQCRNKAKRNNIPGDDNDRVLYSILIDGYLTAAHRPRLHLNCTCFIIIQHWGSFSRVRFEPIEKRLRSRTASVALAALGALLMNQKSCPSLKATPGRPHRSSYSDCKC